MVFVYGVDIWVPLEKTRRWALQQADRVMAISQFTAEQGCRRQRDRHQQIRVLFNCLDPELLRTTRRRPCCSPCASHSGTNQSRWRTSRATTLCCEHSLLLEADPSTSIYDVVGDGDARDRSSRHSPARWEWRTPFGFAVLSAISELSTTYRHASIMVMPSAREGFGFVFLEAMAHGTPVIGGNLDATPEVVTDGETGLVVDPRSVTAVRDAILRILSDDALRRAYGPRRCGSRSREFGFDAVPVAADRPARGGRSRVFSPAICERREARSIGGDGNASTRLRGLVLCGRHRTIPGKAGACSIP